MTQEDTNLLAKNLCARLPYGVVCNTDKGDGHLCSIDYTIFGTAYGINVNPLKRDYFEVQEIKPYLRPMLSMTDKEYSEFIEFHCVNLCPIVVSEMLTILQESKMLDWLNAHHFDYRGLIEKGLALEAPKDMYNFE